MSPVEMPGMEAPHRCPLHAAAPRMLEALERIVYTPNMERADITDVARAAIAQAKEVR